MMLDDFLALENILVTRLQDGIPELAACGSYLTLTTLQHTALVFPSVWVGYGGYQMEGDPLAQGTVQKIRQIWHVSVLVRVGTDPGSGSDVRAAAGPLITKVLKLLMGWKPGDRMRPLELIAAPDPEYGDGVGMFHLSFACSIPLSNR